MFTSTNAKNFLAGHEGLETALNTAHYITKDLSSSLEKWGRLTDKQVELAFRIQKQVAEQANEVKVPVVAGKGITIRGEVVTVKLVADSYGYGTTTKIIVKDDRGFKVWGTAAVAIVNVKKGDVVEFTANIVQSPDDESFGFFSRPRNACFLAQVIN